MSDAPVLEIQHLSRSFGGLKALQDVGFSVREGLIQSVIGPNGAGKTTLFNCISGRMKPDRGAVLFRGVPVTGLKPYRIARLGLTCTFQTTRLFRHMTVLENVMTGRHLCARAGFFSCIFRLPGTAREEKKIRRASRELLEKFGLLEFEDEYAENLSFGKQRLVEFVRALAAEPHLLLLDEPAAGLNIHETGELARFILEIKDMGITVLFIEHDMSLVMEISDHIVVLDRGALLAEGTSREVQGNPEVIRVYLGEDDA